MVGIAERSKNLSGFLKGTIKRFGAKNGSMIAAAISFYGILSVFPLLLLGVAVLAFVIGASDRAFDAVIRFFNSFMPTSTFVIDTLRGLVNSRGAIGIMGIVGLLWTGSQLFVTMQNALNNVWEVVSESGYIKTRIKAILMVIVFGLFLLLSMGSSAAVSWLQSGLSDGALSGVTSVLLSILAIVLGLVFAVAMFVVLYEYLPDSDVHWRSAVIGALFAGIAWTIAKELYRIYVTYYADFNKLYGSLGGVVLLILWIYYSSVILILGAELAYANQHGPKETPPAT